MLSCKVVIYAQTCYSNLLAIFSHNVFSAMPEVNPNPLTPNVSTVYIGESVSLLCDYDGLPIPVVRWFHDGELLDNETDNILIVNHNGSSNLTLSAFRNESRGVYICEASNSVGNNSTPFTIVAMEPTEMSIEPTEMTTQLPTTHDERSIVGTY